jgi:hypothetical protein
VSAAFDDDDDNGGGGGGGDVNDNLERLSCCSQINALPCSGGNTPLKRAIYFNYPDVAAFLRSVGAPE